MSDIAHTVLQAFGRFAVLVLCPFGVVAACDDGQDDDGLGDLDALDAGGALGKADSVGAKGLPVNGNYADTTVWTVKNRWEDRDTPAAKLAGIAWPADSGLSWDEKYAAWVQSLEKIPGHTISQTFELTTPWGKTLPAAKLDCADTALLMRASFAAWYQLPF